MTYFDCRDIAPVPNAEDADFWAHCAQRQLNFQRCAACGAMTHPPIGVCPRCQSLERNWVEAPAEARVYTYTWIHAAAHAALTRSLPYNVAVIEFPAVSGVRLISNIVDATHQTLVVGARVELVWEPIAAGLSLPRFRLAR